MVIASFDHRMSRRGDVQIHTHNAVLNRVRCDDGEWRALDGRALYRVAASAGALYDRVRETCLERDLGVRHEQRKPGGPREIVGVDDEICLFHASACDELTPPLHRTPPRQHAGRPLADSAPRRARLCPESSTRPRFWRHRSVFRCVSSGSHMFVFSSHT